MIVRRKFTAAAFALGVAALPVACFAQSATIKQGALKGAVVEGVEEFWGIPYAAPPVGDLRWKPPQRHARWTTVLDTTQFAHHCPQPAGAFGQATDTERQYFYTDVQSMGLCGTGPAVGERVGLAYDATRMVMKAVSALYAVGPGHVWDPKALVPMWKPSMKRMGEPAT